MKTKTALIYIGRRILDREKGVIANAFVKKLGGKELYWTGRKWLSIGNKYEAIAEGKNLSMAKAPERVGEVNLTEAQREELEREDAACEAVAREIRLSRKAQKKAEAVARESSALRRAIRGMRYSEKRAFVNHVIDKIEELEDK